MRFALTLTLLALAPVGFAATLMAQNASTLGEQEQALRDAKLKAVRAERRSEMLRQEASNATSAADRIVAQRAVLSAEIAAAEAQIEAANARIAIISRRQRAQQKLLGKQSEPILRLNAALQQMTGRPTALMMAQPGHREDYIHVRAVMATVQPQIVQRTNALRQQIANQNELRSQELLALQTLSDARSRLTNRRTALARLEGNARGKADDFAANAAIEFERAIAQGERARDIVGRIDTQRLGSVTAAELAELSGPALRLADDRQVEAQARVYILPAQGKLVSGFHELNTTGYRERGVRLSVAPEARIIAPAAGKVTFAGRYRSYGQIVILEHGNGWNSLITHLGTVRVAKGETVRQGSLLGLADSATGEIGVELRKNGRVMDIAALLR
ncbi:MAG: metalloendopeptidase [Sphingopyxis sp.]|nr:metalloendopeptidase [Sphingopyxis sp.]